MMNDMIYVAPNKLWVNQWFSTMVYRINADTGEIEKMFDMRDHVDDAIDWKTRLGREATPNGLAYHYDPNAENHQSNFLVTGKLWPRIYNLKLNDEDLCGGATNSEVCQAAPASPCWSGRQTSGDAPVDDDAQPDDLTSSVDFPVSLSWFYALLPLVLLYYAGKKLCAKREKKFLKPKKKD